MYMGAEEQEVLYCLSQFKTLRLDQIRKLILKSDSKFSKIISYLIQHGLAYQTDPYLSVTPKAEPNQHA